VLLSFVPVTVPIAINSFPSYTLCIMKKQMRLHKYISNCGYCSRRHAEILITAGLVRVNGTTFSELGTKINLEKDQVHINDELIIPPEPLTIMLNKPPNFITSTHDTHERLTVMDLLPRPVRHQGVIPVGRLDLDTLGLLLMTNNGDLQHIITHPRYECPKEYFVKITGRLSQQNRRRLESGIVLDDGPAQPARIIESKDNKRLTNIRIELKEGKKREIKRMFKAVGHEVIFLKRIRIGPLSLGDLPEGKWRELSEAEIENLKQACKKV